jgi:hypothetical protein
MAAGILMVVVLLLLWGTVVASGRCLRRHRRRSRPQNASPRNSSIGSAGNGCARNSGSSGNRGLRRYQFSYKQLDHCRVLVPELCFENMQLLALALHLKHHNSVRRRLDWRSRGRSGHAKGRKTNAEVTLQRQRPHGAADLAAGVSGSWPWPSGICTTLIGPSL